MFRYQHVDTNTVATLRHHVLCSPMPAAVFGANPAIQLVPRQAKHVGQGGPHLCQLAKAPGKGTVGQEAPLAGKMHVVVPRNNSVSITAPGDNAAVFFTIYH